MPDKASHHLRIRQAEKLRLYNLELIVHSRDRIARSLTLLRQSLPSTFLGKLRTPPKAEPTKKGP
jgi:hypothetical protein